METNRKPYKSDWMKMPPLEQSFSERSFIESVYNDEYVLIVGSRVILNREMFPDTEGDINKFVLNAINYYKHEIQSNFVDYKNFSEVEADRGRGEDLIQKFLIEGCNYDLEELSPELTNLLKTKLFRFVLTTTVDDYLETLMTDVWGKELQIVNIEDSQSLTDLNNLIRNSRQNEYNKPTLVYLFGKVNKDKNKPKNFLKTDSDAIQYIEKWMMRGNGKDELMQFLKSKHMLALGCKFDDWYFRFFWYIITRNLGRDVKDNIQDNIALELNLNDNSDANLHKYLKQQNICLHDKVWDFMTRIHTLLTSIEESNTFRQLVLDKRRKGGIFISYKSCNVVEASKMFCKLANENELNVWFDNTSLDGGSKYAQEIHNAIAHSQIFIPILSKNIAEDIKKKGETLDTFYSQEWRWAKENKTLLIIPVAIGGYNLRGDEHGIFEKIIGMAELGEQISGIDMNNKPAVPETNEKTGYTKLIASIKKHLGLE